MPDPFDKCVHFARRQCIVRQGDVSSARQVLFRRSPLRNAGAWIDVDGRRVLQFGTNDYLGLANHPLLRQAAMAILKDVGVCMPMGARPMSGTTDLHLALERQVAELKRTESALVFTSGAQAMTGCVAALASPRDRVIFDQYAHASLVHGARIAGARTHFFSHNSVAGLESVLAGKDEGRATLVVVDGIYSMHGDMAPLPEICDLCASYGARLLVDDAHGTGICGPEGRGTPFLQGVADRIDLHLGTFSKAPGTMGGFAAGDATVVEYLKYMAPSMLFTKALPAEIAAATLEALKLIPGAEDRRARLWRNARLLQTELRQRGWRVGNTQSPITPLEFPDGLALHVSRALYDEHGIWTCAVVYPAVPIGQSIIRLTPTAHHSEADIHLLISALAAVAKTTREIELTPSAVPA